MTIFAKRFEWQFVVAPWKLNPLIECCEAERTAMGTEANIPNESRFADVEPRIGFKSACGYLRKPTTLFSRLVCSTTIDGNKPIP